MSTQKSTPNPVGNPIVIGKWLLAVAGFIGGVILGWFKGATSKGISGILGMAAMTGFQGFVMTAPDRAEEWLTKAAEAFAVPDVGWVAFVAETMKQLTGTYIDIEPFAEGGVGPGSRQAIELLGETFLQPMLGLILPRAGEVSSQMGIRPEDGMTAANRFFGVNLEFQMKAWLLHMLGDTFSFGMWKGMKDLPNAISWSFGIGWLSWLVMGTPFRMAIADPLEVLYNRMYRPYRFSVAKVADIYWRGHKSIGWFYNQMRDLGVRDPDMEVILAMDKTKVTDAQALRLHRMGKMDFQQLIGHQRDQGHSLAESHALATEMTRREVGKLLEGVAKTAGKHYKDRRMSDGELRQFLAQARWTPEEAGLIITDLKMQMALEAPKEVVDKVLSPANIGRLYQTEKRTRQWAETMLTKRRYRPDEIPDFLELYLPKEEKPPEPKEPPAGLVGWLYTKGKIPLERAKGYWRELELDADYIILLSMRYAPPVPAPPPPPREFSSSEVGKLYQKHYKTHGIAIKNLTSAPIDMRKEDAQMYLEAFYKPVEIVDPPPKEAPVSVVGVLYKKGQESLETFKEHLDLLHFSPKSQKFLIKTYTPPPDVPPVPLPPIEFRPTTIGRLYKERGITREQALSRLVALEPPMLLEDAILYLDTLCTPEELEV